MKRNFFTGLAIILPIVLTIIIVMIIVNLLTKPFMGIVQSLLRNLNAAEILPFLRNEQALIWISKLLILILLFAIILAIGLIGRTFIMNQFFRLGDFIIHRIPVVNKVYRAVQDVVKTLIREEGESFTKAILVPFPHTDVLAVGFLISDKLPDASDADKRSKLSVFVPATPNPTIGYMLLYDKEDIIELDMKIDEAFKFIVSCGISGHTLAPK